MGDGKDSGILFSEEGRKELKNRLEIGTNILREQGWQTNWNKIDKSKYCEGYKNWKKSIGCESYWEIKEMKGELKEQWARLRCGSFGKNGNKGYKDTKCRLCGKEEETLRHIWICKKAREGAKKEWLDEIERKGLTEKGKKYWEKMTELLLEKHNELVCEYSKNFEERAKKQQMSNEH